ncbi:LacI family DNA-binding transcriptional regulator [Chelatococcus sp. SYSU_G07232]|uniref:LacI family DNA-binding transcriptional regulator n=1 Tax=Chelatococcus albus TaxID=3047466 RepID=A0ABT7AG77_9HYPH|nr:LacI family DNA-binding transcriptional regulator [Chelatococcus sp. SYSU_G07232]MDJ1158376.1 LacI family DNA-binding transcriptional regulator [Chelatococcus sp. SYSU_G07232]
MSMPGLSAERHDRHRVTLQVIAEKLSLSTATVSLALRDSAVVAEATKRKVQELARELGYVYNRSAASLRTARTNMIAVGFHDITNPYFAELLSAIEETVSGSGRTVLLGTYAESLEKQARVLSTLREYRPDGMILCAAGGTTPESLNQLTAAGIPVVQVSREIAGVDLDFVGSDDARGTTVAVEHLIGLGHRRIAMIGGSDLISTGRARRRGYSETLARHGLPVEPALIVEGYGTRETGFRGIEALMQLPDPPTAAVCFNDLAAFGAMLGLRHAGREAGRDFSIVGCDDVAEAAQWFPALTTLHNHQDEMGRKAAELLVRRIENPGAPTRRIILEPSLVIRGTTAPPQR